MNDLMKLKKSELIEMIEQLQSQLESNQAAPAPQSQRQINPNARVTLTIEGDGVVQVMGRVYHTAPGHWIEGRQRATFKIGKTEFADRMTIPAERLPVILQMLGAVEQT